MSYAKAYQQVKEDFLYSNSKDRVGHSLELGDLVFWKRHQRRTAFGLRSKGPYQVFLTTNTAVKLEGIEPWVRTSQLRKPPPDIWSCTDAGDPWTKL